MKRENKFINGIIENMSLDEKVGALLTLGFAGTIPRHHIYEYIEKYHCGGLRLSCDMRTFGSYVDPNSQKAVVSVEAENGVKYKKEAPVCSASDYKSVLDELQKVARNRKHSIPLHFSFDQEGGTSADFCFGGVNIYPKPMGIRATNDPNVAYEVSIAISKQSKVVGFNWVHSPVLDVNSEPKNPEIYTRSYSDDPEEVVEYAVRACEGFKEGKMIATGKHFPGRGHSDIDAHFKVPVIDVDKETMLKRELLPYIKLIEKDILPSIMIAHSIFPAFDKENIATVSKPILTDLLRNELKFKGVIATDSMTMGAISTQYGVANACALSLQAGADLVLMKAETSLVKETIDTIKEFVSTEKITIDELNQKVYRVLNTKYEYGLFYNNEDNNIIPETIINDYSVKELAKKVAKQSVLIANDEVELLPLNKEQKVLIVEQKVKGYNTFQWHSGILFEECDRYSSNVYYLEMDYHYTSEDEERFNRIQENYDVIVFTNYYIRGNLCNKKFIEEYIASTNKNVIVVTNTPYEELSIPSNSKTTIVTFATSPENIKITAGTMFGKVQPEGHWPISKERFSSK